MPEGVTVGRFWTEELPEDFLVGTEAFRFGVPEGERGVLDDRGVFGDGGVEAADLKVLKGLAAGDGEIPAVSTDVCAGGAVTVVTSFGAGDG